MRYKHRNYVARLGWIRKKVAGDGVREGGRDQTIHLRLYKP